MTVLHFNEVGMSRENGLRRLPLLETVLAASNQLTEVSLKLGMHHIKVTRTARMIRSYWPASQFEVI